MKKTYIILGAVVLGLGVFSLGFFSKYLTQKFYKPKTLVSVNGVGILDVDLKREMQFLKVSDNMAFSNITRGDVLDRLINDALILEEAKRLKVVVAEEKVAGFMNGFWNGSAEGDSERMLKEQHLTPEDWRMLVTKRLTIEQTINQAVEERIHVGDDEVEEFYWTHLLQFYRQVRVHARQIVVETREQADTLRQKLEAGTPFQELAAQYSRGPEKDQGGDLGWVGKEDLPQTFTKVLFQLKPGKPSDPVATEYGYHIFLVEKRERGGKIPLEEAKKMIARDLRLAKTDKAFRVWLEDLRSQAEISIHNRQGVGK
ncbi:peptidylprolyl isomerase [bacterium]|nr:peptidylprolyl isomerase [bacterium]